MRNWRGGLHGIGRGLTVMQTEANPSAIAEYSPISSNVTSLHIYRALQYIFYLPYKNSNYAV